jgi:hypothetical protein
VKAVAYSTEDVDIALVTSRDDTYPTVPVPELLSKSASRQIKHALPALKRHLPETAEAAWEVLAGVSHKR